MSMVERVAAAIWQADDLGLDETWEECSCKSMVLDQARAAIEAMMEPTDEMVEAGENDGGHSIYRWQSMITAALKEG